MPLLIHMDFLLFAFLVLHIYKSEDGIIKIDVLFADETVWLTQGQMSSLFQRDRPVITKHVNNVFDEGELDAASNVHFLHVANSDKPVKYYSLDVIISVGYRVKYALYLEGQKQLARLESIKELDRDLKRLQSKKK